MKQRQVGKMMLLQLATFLGVFVSYYAFWSFKFQAELRDESAKGILPWGHILIVFLPVVNLVYYIYWLCVVDRRLIEVGAPGKNRWFLYLLLFITVVGIFFIPPLIQAKANGISSNILSKDEKQTKLRVDKYAKYLNVK